ncbi:hypothetical protein D1164_17075 [Mariniphaga sediminis]|uniref:Uncharacterized protein n=1 Tax=Mariniphaga sediminis TaxID=1628158 RepID=A0A399CY09_9BACT|nr:hypothetical protein [Mariniphaga sediminis]RIH64043.1 hypothetical protein D1164_17075 [Mariniphaga sediminis]
MMMSLKKYGSLMLLLFVPFWVAGQQLKVEIEGDANFSNSLIPVREAGEDYSSTIEHESSLYISVLYVNYFDYWFNPNKKWSVYVHKSDIEWNSDFTIKARRTGNGSRVNWFAPGVNIHDGTNYQEISNNPVYFFRGRHGIAYIPLSFQLSGFSVTMGAKDFETSLVFTVYDDW